MQCGAAGCLVFGLLLTGSGKISAGLSADCWVLCVLLVALVGAGKRAFAVCVQSPPLRYRVRPGVLRVRARARRPP